MGPGTSAEGWEIPRGRPAQFGRILGLEIGVWGSWAGGEGHDRWLRFGGPSKDAKPRDLWDDARSGRSSTFSIHQPLEILEARITLQQLPR